MPKRKARRAHRTAKQNWAGFSPTQLLIIFSVFVIFAIFYMM